MDFEEDAELAAQREEAEFARLTTEETETQRLINETCDENFRVALERKQQVCFVNL